MDVRCPQCDTVYEVDARQLRGGAATLQCSQCEQVFRLQTAAALNRENQRRWMVRSTSGDILYFSGFDQLHQWILEGKVDKSDQISRTGKKWRRLQSIGEFQPIFQAVASISSISASHAAEKRAADDGDGSRPTPRPGREQDQPGSALSEQSQPDPRHTPVDPSRSQTPAPQRATSAPKSSAPPPPQQPAAPPPPTPAAEQREEPRPEVRLQTGAFGAAVDEAGDDDEWSFGDAPTLGEAEGAEHFTPGARHGARRSRWPAVLVVVLLVVAGAAAGVYLLRPDLVEPYLPLAESNDAVDIASSAAEPDIADADQKPPEELVGVALDEALASAQTTNDGRLSAAINGASPQLGAGVDQAREAATTAANEAAAEPEPGEILDDAQRYLEDGRPRRARKAFQRVLAADRNNVKAITGLGWSLLAMESPASASAQFRKALRLNPGFGNAYIGLGKAEREQGDREAALEAYRDYLDRFPDGQKVSIAQYQAKKLEETLGR